MSPDERKNVAREFTGLNAYYHRQPMQDSVLAMYVEDVDDLDYGSVRRALLQLRRDPRRRTMPLPAEVRALVAPAQSSPGPEAEANLVAGRIVHAVGRFGYMQGSEARAALGELAWSIIVAKGGWENICASLNAADSGFYAQCRDLARSLISQRGMAPQMPMLTPRNENALQDSQSGARGGIVRVQQLVDSVLKGGKNA